MKIFAADIGGTTIKYCISDEIGNLIDLQEINSESNKGGQFIINKLKTIISEYSDLDAICISTAGQVNSEKGYIIYASENIPNYTGTKVKEQLEKKFQIPVLIENDANSAALGERYFGSGIQFSSFIFITIGTGIGGGIILESQLYRGIDGGAGEFGHMITHPNGLLCNCGNLGCYEQYGSTTALIKRASKIDSECTNGRILFQKMKQSNKLLHLFDNWAEEVALGIYNLIHIFNPEAVIIGGGIMEQDSSVNVVSKKLNKLLINNLFSTELVKTSLGNKAGLYGAVSLKIF